MTSERKLDLSRVAPERREAVTELAGVLVNLFGDDLLSLALYGPCVCDDVGRDAPLTSLAVVRNMVLDRLQALAEQGLRLADAGLPAPLMMTPEFIRRSLDTFALEFLEARQFHVMLLGPDPFGDLALQREHLRLEIEWSFKRMLLDLRQGLLSSAGDYVALAEVNAGVGRRLLVVLRGLLWLRGLSEALPVERVLSESERLAGGGLHGMRRAISKELSDPWEDFKALYAEVEQLVRLSDELS